MGFASSCAQDSYRSARAMAPVPAKPLALMFDQGMEPGAPILMRAFKRESEIEVWKQGRDGKYALLKTYPICRWSGQLGPKTVQHMTSDHLGPEIRSAPSTVDPHREGFRFGLGVAVRTTAGLSAVPGNPGEYSWNGAYGTQFFADPS